MKITELKQCVVGQGEELIIMNSQMSYKCMVSPRNLDLLSVIWYH